MTPDDVIPGLETFSGLERWGPIGFLAIFLIGACTVLFFAWQRSQNGRLQDNKDNQKDTLTALNNSTTTISALKDAITNQANLIVALNKAIDSQAALVTSLREEVAELKGRLNARSSRG